MVTLLDTASGVLEYLCHELYIQDGWHVGEVVSTGSQECRDDLFQDGVFGTERLHGSGKTRTTLHEDLGHQGESTPPGRDTG
jgi:hypothetical protein